MRVSIHEVFLGHDEVAAFEEGCHSTTQEHRTYDAVQHQEELECPGTQQIAEFVLELITDSLQHKREQDNHPQPVRTTKAGGVEQGEGGKEGATKRHERGEREFPLATCRVDDQSAAFGITTQRTNQGIGTLHKQEEYQQGS